MYVPKVTVREPKEITADIVQYYCPERKQLAKSQQSKALKFIKLNCVEKISSGWIIKPIKGYNSTTYLVSEDLTCNCQGYQTKLKKGETPNCSHILAVRYFMRMKK